jgi:threonine dehydrogenase-like Zn-dependent dehydrogenase
MQNCSSFRVYAPLTVSLKEVEMKGSLAYTADELMMVIDFLAQKKIKTEPMISEVIRLDDIQEKGFQRLASSRDVVKILVQA